MKAPLLLALVLPPLLAGCLSRDDDAGPAAAAAAAEPPAPADPWEGAERVALVHRDGAGAEFDVLCAFGGGIEMVRSDGGQVLPGTARLEVAIRQSPTWRGSQVGYSVDGGDVTWLAPVWTDARTFEIEVPPALVEEDAWRWAFHWQLDLPEPASRGCYTGAATGEVEVLIEAVRG